MTLLCNIANVTTSAYYKWVKRDFSKNNNLKEIMNHIFFSMYDKTCGYRRMHSELHDLGIKISEKKTREKMSEFGLVCEIRRKKKSKNYDKANGEEKIVKNLLNRQFKPDKPNQKYCTDMTIIETDEAPIYCSTIIDLFNIQPFGIQLSYSCNTDLAKLSVTELKKHRNLDGSLLHSDQGVTYTSKAFSDLLTSLNISQSMSKRGCPYDNSPMENFWGTLKVEKINRLHKRPKNSEELKKIIEEYFDFYINTRKNSLLGNLTPAKFYDKYIQNLKNVK